MQFLPLPSIDNSYDVSTVVSGVANHLQDAANNESFDTVYSSFIEEDREDYTGRAAGFSALEEETGTISREKAEALAKEMKKRNVPEASMHIMEQMAASDMPMTIGRIFGSLTGARRINEQMSAEEAEGFTSLMGKFGFSTDDTAELVRLSDEGKTHALWQRITQQMEKMEADGVRVEGKEFTALLKGLDISESVGRSLQKTFGENPRESYGKDQLKVLLGEAGQEIADKERAAKAVQKHLRPAMADALQNAKLTEISEPVANTRGSSRSSANEMRMQVAAQKKATEQLEGEGKEAGNSQVLSQVKADAAEAAKTGQSSAPVQTVGKIEPEGSSKDGGFNFGSNQDTQSRAERILSTQKAHKSDEAPVVKDMVKDAVNDMMGKVSVAGVNEPLMGNNGSQQDLMATARQHRQEIFSQVEQGILQNASNGNRQLTLQLNPENLGQMTLVLTMQHGELKAVLRADKAETTTVLQEQMAELKAGLEEQGIKVAEIDVQTRTAEDSSHQQWSSSHEHNQMHDAQERARQMRLSQIRREVAEANAPTLEASRAVAQSGAGLYIIA